MSVLRVDDLWVDLGGRSVVRSVGLDLGPGEFVGLLGPNGAGKTTLLRALLGLLPARRGSVQVRDDSGTGLRPSRPGHRGVGYVPQRHEFAWDFPISVEDAVMTGRTALLGWRRRPRRADWAAVTDAIDLAELGPLRTRPVGALSGGQRQRVLVARALASRPSLLLLDEPFTGLDLPTQELLTGLLTRLTERGDTVLMTTHDLIGALHACSRLVLFDGSVVADGTPDGLRDPEPWRRCFGVRSDHPLLAVIEAVR